MKSLIPWRWGQKSAAPVRGDDWSDRWWDNPFGMLLGNDDFGMSARLPSVDMADNGKEVTIRAEIPGMDEKDVELTWHDGILTIRGEKRDEKEEKKGGRHYRECSYGSFSRSLNVGRTVDWEKAKANYKKGVLTVKLPKTAAEEKALRIEVK